jgi:hypothetical protein
MTPRFPPQCTKGNKNDSAVRKGWVEILPTSQAQGGVVVLFDLSKK